MKMSHVSMAAALLVSAGVAHAATSTVLSDTFDSSVAGWKFSGNGAGYKSQSTATFDPGFGTGSYMTPVSTSYDDNAARAFGSTAHLVAGGKVTLSFDYYLSPNSKAYNLRFGIYSGTNMVKNGFEPWNSALTDTNTQVDWKGYVASLSVGGSGKSDSLYTLQNTASSNFLWGGWGSTNAIASTTYGSTPTRNDGNARTVVMELLLSDTNTLTINLYEGLKGSISSTPSVTTTITNASYILTDFNYMGLLMRSPGSLGTAGDTIAFDNVTASVFTPDPIPEAATFGFMMTCGATLWMRRKK